MYCWKCGKELHEDARFCSFCGAEQKTVAAAAPVNTAQAAAQPDAPERTAQQQATPERTAQQQPQPARNPAPQNASPASGTNQAGTQEPEKKTWKNYLYLPLTALLIYLAVDNINSMNNGGIYTVWLGIPIQYILIPGAIIIFIGGIVSNSKKK